MSKEMKVELNFLLEDVITTPLDQDRGRIIIIFNSIKFLFRTGENDLTVEDKTIRYDLYSLDNGLQNEIRTCQVIDKKFFNISSIDNLNTIQKGEKLTSLLSDISIEPSEEILFVTWDHGSAFGIFREVEFNPQQTLPVPREPIDEELDKYPYLKKFWQRALKEEGFEEFLKKIKIDKPPRLVEFRAEIYKLSGNEETTEMFFTLLKSNARELFNYEVSENKLVATFDGSDETKKAALAFSGLSNQFSDLVNEITASSKTVKLELSSTGVREILRNDELGRAISAWLKEKKAGVILMMNCWMMNLHTIFSLKDCTEFLVAPVGDISIPGYNYKDIIAEINNHPFFASAKETAFSCVDTCHNPRAKENMSRLNTKDPRALEKWLIIAMDMQANNSGGTRIIDAQLTALNGMINELNENLKEGTNLALKHLLKYARFYSFEFTSSDCFMIDMVHWLQTVDFANSSLPLGSKLLSVVLHDKIAQFDKDARSKLLKVNTFQGEHVYPANTGAITSLEPTGHTLFFPHRNFNNSNVLDNVKNDGLLKDFLKNWKTLVETIIEIKLP